MLTPRHTSRRRDAAATRAALLLAARRRFAEQGYDNTGMREVAALAGVDVSLVARYFGSKEELFDEVLAGSGDPTELMAGDPAGLPERIAHEVTYAPDRADKLEGLLIILRSISSPKAREMAQRSANERYLKPFAAWLGGPDAELRARLVLGVIMGAALSRVIHDGGSLDDAAKAELCRRTASLLEAAIASPP